MLGCQVTWCSQWKSERAPKHSALSKTFNQSEDSLWFKINKSRRESLRPATCQRLRRPCSHIRRRPVIIDDHAVIVDDHAVIDKDQSTSYCGLHRRPTPPLPPHESTIAVVLSTTPAPKAAAVHLKFILLPKVKTALRTEVLLLCRAGMNCDLTVLVCYFLFPKKARHGPTWRLLWPQLE
jgi:hypothetical protein